MSTNAREVTIGGLAFLALVLLLGFLYGGRELTAKAASSDYLVVATFNRVDGLLVGAPVRLAGIQIGTVDGEYLDVYYRAVTTLKIDSDVKLPTDTSVAIHTDGLFGTKYVVLEPGGDEEFLGDGEEIDFTQDAVIVSELLELIIAQGKANRKRRTSQE
jgi:phospholipid/cholesterol/gamma-HCH transport system substrate-binding protein